MSPTTLNYEATIEDPTVWQQPWTYEIPMQWNEQTLYEYACHEGNYGLYNILAGARTQGSGCGGNLRAVIAADRGAACRPPAAHLPQNSIR